MKRAATVLPLVVGAFLLALPARAQSVTPPVYFYITSDPATLRHAYSPILRARVKQFDGDRVLAQYFLYLRRVLREDWFNYAHHAFVHGPFASEADAKSDYDRDAGGGIAARVYPRELVGFQYFDAAVLLAVVKASSQASPAAGINLPPWERALSGSPVAVYWPGEYTWERPSGASSSTTATVDEVQASGAVIWVDEGVNLARGSEGARLLQENATNALKNGLDALVAMPGRAPAAANNAISPLASQFAAKGKRLEVALADASAMKDTVSRRLREFLSLPAIPLKVNELMANNRTAVKGPAGDFPDWVEILNGGSVPIDLEGMHISDKDDARSMRRIPTGDSGKTRVAPGGYFVLWLDGHTELGPNHVALSLSSQGERFTLMDIDGRTVIDRIEYGPQAIDKSFARVPDGANSWSANREPTPGAANR